MFGTNRVQLGCVIALSLEYAEINSFTGCAVVGKQVDGMFVELIICVVVVCPAGPLNGPTPRNHAEPTTSAPPAIRITMNSPNSC